MWSFFFIALALLILAVLASTLWLGNPSHQKRLRAFSASQGWTLHYRSRNDYLVEGRAGAYPLALSPLRSQPQWVKASLPMTNPNGKYLSIGKNLEHNAWWQDLYRDDFASIKHDLGAEFQVRTNDPWFSSFLLVDEVKTHIQQTFEPLEHGGIFILGNEFSAVLPANYREPQGLISMLNLLTFVKDELNRR